MPLINDDLSSVYEISISISHVTTDGKKNLIQTYGCDLKLDQKQLEALSKHLKMTNNSLDEFTCVNE